jgi:hypothetical protein
MSECTTCNGTTKIICNNCSGSGKLICPHCGGSSKKVNGERCYECSSGGIKCPPCDGDGWIRCPQCKNCFITSAVMETLQKEDDCNELAVFRNFRDNWLQNEIDGNALIEEYYQIAPRIVKNIGKKENYLAIYQTIWSQYLERCLNLIEMKQFEEAKMLYLKMVGDLKLQYGVEEQL